MTLEQTPTSSRLASFTETPLSRRRFLAATAGALVVGFALEPRAARAAVQPAIGLDPVGANINGWVVVDGAGVVTILYGGAEMGQGSSTGLAQLVAEELGASWSDVVVQYVSTDRSWTTGGSSGITRHFTDMRLAGAQAREMLKEAARIQWGLGSRGGLVAAESKVKNPANTDPATNTLTFAQLAAAASGVTGIVVTNADLVKSGIYVGVSMPRLDIPAKTNGTAKFGIDVVRPGMTYAVVRNSPVLGGTLKATPAIPIGATAVVNLGNAVAVVAANTWAAIMASKQLSASWLNPADAASNTTSTITSTAQTLLASGTPVVAEPATGGTGPALAAVGATPTVDATYYVPYLAHVPMEVPNATVEPTYADGAKTILTQVDIWLPTQAPKSVLSALRGMTTAAGALWIPAGATINVHPTLLGGGFGRKIEVDYAIHAAKTALTLKRPVKVTWPREEDVTHDQYRPMAMARIRATLDPTTKNIAGWHARTATPSISHQRGRLAAGAVDGAAVECLTLASGVPYLPAGSATHATEWVRHTSSVWVGYWRSVGASMNVFFSESAIDELAGKAGLDELAFRKQLLQAAAAAGDPRAARFIAVLDEVARISNWAAGVPSGRARGISVATCFGSVVAEVVEVSKVVNATTGVVSMKVHNVWVALDCGNVVNPNAVEAQVQGAVSYGLSATLWSQITFTSGKADQQNFNRYRMLKGSEMPVVTTSILRTTADPSGGVGEVAVPGIAPAVATAWSKLNGGTRYRSLPLFPGATMGG